MQTISAKKTLFATLVLAALVVVGFGATTLMTSPAQAVGCPPPQGRLTNISCGGITGAECPGNLVCVDDPGDDCCPNLGGRDCSGLCARQ